MKNLNTPVAIIISAIIIYITAYLISLNDPLEKCMDRLIADGKNTLQAAHFCSGKSNK